MKYQTEIEWVLPKLRKLHVPIWSTAIKTQSLYLIQGRNDHFEGTCWKLLVASPIAFLKKKYVVHKIFDKKKKQNNYHISFLDFILFILYSIVKKFIDWALLFSIDNFFNAFTHSQSIVLGNYTTIFSSV